MKSKKKFELIEVKEHGNMYVEPDSVFVCPECGADSESGFEGESVEWRQSGRGKYVGESLFHLTYADIFTCHCCRCGCKWEEKRRMKNDTKWEIVVGIIAVLIVVLVIIFAVVFGHAGSSEAVETVL